MTSWPVPLHRRTTAGGRLAATPGPAWTRPAASWRAPRGGQPPGGLLETIGGLLDSLAPLEQYWAFPGPEACRRARDLFASANYERFASLVARINRALTTESYPSGAAWSVVDEHDEVGPDETAAGPASPARPYFEVLVVETLTPAQEQALREEVRGWRRPADPFIYELVVVGSAQEAIVAAQLNASLQACVVRRRFASDGRARGPGSGPVHRHPASPRNWTAWTRTRGRRSWPGGWPGCARSSTST